MTRPSYN